MRIDNPSSRAGFTLLEIIVAFAILGIAGGAIMSMFGNSTGKVARAENERLAILSAQSVLALVGTEVPLMSGARQGQMPDGESWSLSIRPYDVPVPESKDTAATTSVTTPYLVTVETTSKQASASISSIRLKVGNP